MIYTIRWRQIQSLHNEAAVYRSVIMIGCEFSFMSLSCGAWSHGQSASWGLSMIRYGLSRWIPVAVIVWSWTCANDIFMARLTVVKGHIAVGLWGQNLGRFFLLFKNTFWGFLSDLGHTWNFRHRLSFVCWTCPRVLAGSTWNLFRSTIYELKLCTSYCWSASVRPFVCERRRNLGPDNIWQFQVIFSDVLSWTPPTVLDGSIWNLYRLNIYGLKLYTSPWGRCRSVRLSVRGVGT